MQHKAALDDIKTWLMTGAITYARARELAAPHITAMNERSKEIAKKHGVRPKHISFSAFMR